MRLEYCGKRTRSRGSTSFDLTPGLGSVMVGAMRFGGGSQDYCTPQELLEPVYEFGEIELDPCSNPNSIVRARHHIMPLEYMDREKEFGLVNVSFGDGLAGPWPEGLTFVNPPFRNVVPWLEKAEEEARTGSDVILLLNADTSTAWFQDFVYPRANRICFRRGRVRFLGARSTNPFPHLYVYFGGDGVRFEQAFKPVGVVL